MKIVNCLELEEWSDFVLNHPKGSVFQTPYMGKVYRESVNFTPFFIAVLSDKGEVLAILLAVIQKEYKGVLGNFTARAIIMGGPLVKEDDKKVLFFLMNQYNKQICKKAIFTQIRNQFDQEKFKEIFSSQGYIYEEHLNIILDISKTEEVLWKEVYTKRRNEIKRALKEDVSFEVFNSVGALNISYDILNEVYSRAKLPLPNFSHFIKLFEHSNKNEGLRIGAAIYDGKIIGCMLFLVYKKTIYDYYAGSYAAFYKKFPNHLIPWEVFKWGKENGYTVFDFGGAGKPDVPYGVREYKKKFGGAFVNYGRFINVHKKITYKFAKIGFSLWQKIKK